MGEGGVEEEGLVGLLDQQAVSNCKGGVVELKFFNVLYLEFGKGILKLLVGVVPEHYALSWMCPTGLILEKGLQCGLDAASVLNIEAGVFL